MGIYYICACIYKVYSYIVCICKYKVYVIFVFNVYCTAYIKNKGGILMQIIKDELKK